MTPSAVATARNLTKTYGEGDTVVHALRGVDVDVARGEFVAIMGPSGSGKSTLMHLLAGLDSPTAGSVQIDNRELSAMKDKELTELRRSTIGFIFQAYNLIPTLNAQENIELPLRLGGDTPDAAWIDKVIDTLGLDDRRTHRPSELSGGQQQRVAIARALATKPAIVFADEPTGALDSNSSHELLQFLRTAVDDLGQSIAMVTHDPTAASWATRVLFLRDGSIVSEAHNPDRDAILDEMRKLGEV